VGWVGLGQSADGLGWIGSHKMDPWTTLATAVDKVSTDIGRASRWYNRASRFVG